MDNRKIEKITEEQWAIIAQKREEWRAVGLSTERSDRKTAEEAVTGLYRIAGEEPPEFRWFDSPFACCRKSAEEECEGQGEGVIKAKAREIYDARLSGQAFVWWVAHYVVARDVLGVTYEPEDNEALDLWAQVVSSTGPWFAFRGGCYMSERLDRAKFDDEQRLHCEDGPALRYPDGYSVYSWHGTRIPKEWIEGRKTLDPATALTWPNIEQRRCAAEIIGWHIVLEQLDAKTIDKDEDPQIGTLVEADLPDAPAERFLVVQCGTGRTFALPVPPEMKTALEANAWSYKVDPEEIIGLEVRT